MPSRRNLISDYWILALALALVGWFLGLQNARAPLVILLTTNAVNIALNLWFVIGLDWGVVGSARASVLAEWVGALLGLALTHKGLRDYPGQLALSALKRPCAVTLFLDSEYVRKGITEWIHGWKAKGWRTASNQPVKNVELWKRLDTLVNTGGHRIE